MDQQQQVAKAPLRHTLLEDIYAGLTGCLLIVFGLVWLKAAGLVTGGVAGLLTIFRPKPSKNEMQRNPLSSEKGHAAKSCPMGFDRVTLSPLPVSGRRVGSGLVGYADIGGLRLSKTKAPAVEMKTRGARWAPRIPSLNILTSAGVH